MSVFKAPSSKMTKIREEINSVLGFTDHCASVSAKLGAILICAK